MVEQLRSAALLAGRILLSAIFLLSGVTKVMNWSQTAQSMEKEGMFAVPFFLFMAILFELVGGLSVLFGCGARLGALALVLFLVPTTLIFHDFWAHQDPGQMMNQMQHFMKNLTIVGGLLTLAGAGAGAFSFDAWFARRQTAVRGLRPREPAMSAR